MGTSRIRKTRFMMTAVLGLFLCFFGWESLASASDLPPGVIVGDDSGIRADKEGKYFIEHNDITPGLTFKKEITISNYSQEKDPFKLRLAMEGDTVEGEINLLEAITVKLELEGTVIYEGTLSGKSATSSSRDPLDLGTYKVGDTKVMTATFNVDSDLPEDHWKDPSKADFYWVFYGTKESEPIESSTSDTSTTESSTTDSSVPPIIKPKPPLLPQTGEEWAFVIMGIVIGVFVVMISLIVAKKKRNSMN